MPIWHFAPDPHVAAAHPSHRLASGAHLILQNHRSFWPMQAEKRPTNYSCGHSGASMDDDDLGRDNSSHNNAQDKGSAHEWTSLYRNTAVAMPQRGPSSVCRGQHSCGIVVPLYKSTLYKQVRLRSSSLSPLTDSSLIHHVSIRCLRHADRRQRRSFDIAAQLHLRMSTACQ